MNSRQKDIRRMETFFSDYQRMIIYIMNFTSDDRIKVHLEDYYEPVEDLLFDFQVKKLSV